MVYYTSRRKREKIWKDGIGNKKLKKLQEIFETPLTNGKLCDIIQRSLQNDNHGKERMENKNLKKVEKTFKKYLTTAKRCGIINKLSERQIKPQGKAYVP